MGLFPNMFAIWLSHLYRNFDKTVGKLNLYFRKVL